MLDPPSADEHLTVDGVPGTVGGLSRFKEFAKALARGTARVIVLPVYLSYRFRTLLLGEAAFRSSVQLLSVIPGLVGDYVRREFLRLTLPACGKTSQVAFGTLVSSPRATIGEHVYIGPRCVIGWADIGRDVLLGSGVHVLSGSAQHLSSRVDLPVRLQGGRLERVRVGEDTWIGDGAILLADVGRKCIVGAGSVVVAAVEDYSVVAGNPARILRQRDRRER